ncbi:MAG: hypothetical protein C0405_12505, partial [Desulfovibrio sp.]|nr:hypothetical protein [Desulfovibrio sp.]
MSEPTTKNDLGERVWNFFASVKLSFALLLILAVTSILGTVIPQKEDPSAYVRAFGEAGAKLVFGLRLHDMYHAPWFVMILALLAVNLLICSINRLPTTLKLMAKDPEQDVKRPSQAQESFTLAGDPASHAPQAQALLAKAFGPVTQADLDKGLALFAEKGAWSRLAVYLVHLSVLIIFVGAIVGNIFGFSGRLHLHEGDMAEAIELDGGTGMRPLGFGLRLEKFTVSFYPDGMPSEYRSDVTFLDQGKEVMKAALMVNDPADYRGVDFYQSTYGSEHLLQVDVKRGDKVDRAVLKTGAWTPLPGGGQAGVLEYREHVNMGPRYQGPLARVLYQANEN